MKTSASTCLLWEPNWLRGLQTNRAEFNRSNAGLPPVLLSGVCGGVVGVPNCVGQVPIVARKLIDILYMIPNCLDEHSRIFDVEGGIHSGH